MAAIGVWALPQAVEVLAHGEVVKLWAAKLQYPGIAATPVLWFLFSVVYAGRESMYKGRASLFIWFVPVLTVALVMTNEFHGWMWSDVAYVTREGQAGLDLTHGPFFYFHAVYSYGLMIAGTAILAWTLANVGRRWEQFAAVLVAPSVIGAANLFYLSSWYPSQWLDLTPLAFALGALILCGSLFHRSVPDLRPIARTAVMDRISDAVFVLDAHGLLSDLNPAAAAVIGSQSESPIGRPFVELVDAPVLGGQQLEEGGEVRDLPLRQEGDERTYDVRISLLRDAKRKIAGRVLVLRETTERLRIERGLREARTSLEQANRELERLANTDTLTGLSNRRHFTATLDAELRRALRHDRPLSLIILDLDHFKQVNDRYGHGMGDRVLKDTARAVLDVVREVDLVGRLGGEEFAVLVPETEMEGALRLAERIRASVAASDERDSRGEPLRVTASLGVASLGLSGSDADTLLLAADNALYRAKEKGRNRSERAVDLVPATSD